MKKGKQIYINTNEAFIVSNLISSKINASDSDIYTDTLYPLLKKIDKAFPELYVLDGVRTEKIGER